MINQGKLAVIMGIETSVPFGCTFKNLPGGDVPACDVASIDAQLDEMHRLGVRQMELVNKFDNALTGVAGDEGETGVAVNSANLLETGSYWDMRTCRPATTRCTTAPSCAPSRRSAASSRTRCSARSPSSPTWPTCRRCRVYPPAPHCNALGLSSLGEHLVNKLAGKHMLIDPDHMSVKARQKLLDILEDRQYPGVLSSHSWSTPDAYPRIYRLGGFVAPYAGDSTGFYAKWQRHLGWADKRFYFGFGYGADMNGLGAQGNPRGKDVSNPVTYPFTGLHGVTVHKQRSGTPGLRRQRRGRAALRHVPRLDPGPAQARRPPGRRRDRRRHGPRGGGLPPDLGARRGRPRGRVPQPGAPRRRRDVPRPRAAGDDHARGAAGGGPALHAARLDVRHLREDVVRPAGEDEDRPSALVVA